MYCSVEKDRPFSTLSDKEWLRIIEEFGVLEEINMVAFEGGEPFLRKSLPDLAAAALVYANKVKVITSGAINPKKFIEKNGKNPKVRMEFSMDGLEETHNQLRDSSYKRTINSLEQALQTDMEIAVRTVISTFNIDEYPVFLQNLDQFLGKFKKKVDVFFDVILPPNYLMTKNKNKKQKLRSYPTEGLVPSQDKIMALFIYLTRQQFKYISFKQNEPFRGCDFANKSFISLSPSGEYSFCCESEDTLGNIVIDRVEKCYKRVLEFHKKSNCKSCEYHQQTYCGGCSRESKCGLVSYYGFESCKAFFDQIVAK